MISSCHCNDETLSILSESNYEPSVKSLENVKLVSYKVHTYYIGVAVGLNNQ